MMSSPVPPTSVSFADPALTLSLPPPPARSSVSGAVSVKPSAPALRTAMTKVTPDGSQCIDPETGVHEALAVAIVELGAVSWTR